MLLGLLRQYRGVNNGDLSATFASASEWGIGSKATLAKALEELQERNLIIRTREGRFISQVAAARCMRSPGAPSIRVTERLRYRLPLPHHANSASKEKTPGTETVPTGYRNCTHGGTKNTLMGTETVPMERFHLVQKLYLDIPGAAWDLDLLIYLFCSSRKPSDVRGIRILAGAGADLARAHIIQGRINPQGEVEPSRPGQRYRPATRDRRGHRQGEAVPHPWAERPRQRRWEPLLAIADQADDHWPKSARNAAIALHGLEGESPSIGAELLADVKAVFEAKSASKVFSADLLEALVADEEAPWATWNRGKPMSPRQLSAKLADFGVKSGTVRVGVMTKRATPSSSSVTLLIDTFPLAPRHKRHIGTSQ